MKPLNTDANALWKQRYRVSTTWVQLANGNPARGMAVSNRSGVYQLYAWDVQSGDLRRLTDYPAGKTFGVVAGDGRFVYYLADTQGNELGHYVRVPFEGGPPEDLTPDLLPYASFDLTSSRNGARVCFTASDQSGFRTYALDVPLEGTSGAPHLLHTTPHLTLGLKLSAGGEWLALGTSEGMHGVNFSLLALDTASGTDLGRLSDGPDNSVQARFFSPLPGDARLAAVSNRSGANRPLIWNIQTGERIDLELGDLPGDIEPQDWSPDGAQILLLQIYQAVFRLYTYRLDDGALTPLPELSGTIFDASFRPDGELFVQLESATTPRQMIALDAATGVQTRVVMPAPAYPPSRPWRSVSFPSSDGQMIQGWLAVPEGDGPFPTILETHGGPTAAMTEVCHRACQAWLDHGFAFLTINYRGSTTFGKAFEQQIWGDLGHWEVEDMAAARDWLVHEGIADPQSILLTGWSYGGYLTLQALGVRPELWAGGMAGIAIADWAMQYDDSAETLRGYQAALFGGTPEEKPDVYAASSPSTYAERVAAPVLVIQGSNDTRCPPRPMRMYEEQMRALGKEIEVVWFDAGHGSYVVELSIEHQERMLRFAYRVLG